MEAAAAIPMIISAGGQLLQARAASKAGKHNQRVAEENALVAEREGEAEYQRIRDASRLWLGRQLGAQAESGFEIGTGSAIDELRESATEFELEALEARRSARSRARALRAGGELARREGKAGLVAGLFGAAGTIASYRRDYAQLNREYGRGG